MNLDHEQGLPLLNSTLAQLLILPAVVGPVEERLALARAAGGVAITACSELGRGTVLLDLGYMAAHREPAADLLLVFPL